MGGEEDSVGSNSSRLCARYLSSALSLRCSLVLHNTTHPSPPTLHSLLSAYFSRSSREGSPRKTNNSNFLENNKEPSEAVRKKTLSRYALLSTLLGSILHRVNLQYIVPLNYLQSQLSPLRLLSSLHSGDDGGGWLHINQIEDGIHNERGKVICSISSLGIVPLPLPFPLPLMLSLLIQLFFPHFFLVLCSPPLPLLLSSLTQAQYPYNAKVLLWHSSPHARLANRQRYMWGVRGEGWGVRGEGWGVRVEGWGVRGEGWGVRSEEWGVRSEGRAASGERRGAREDEKEAKGGTHHLEGIRRSWCSILPANHVLFVYLWVWFNKQFSCFGWMFKSTQRYAPYFHTRTIANLNFKITKD